MRISDQELPERSFGDAVEAGKASRVILSSERIVTRSAPKAICNPFQSPIAALIDAPCSFAIKPQGVDIFHDAKVFAQRMVQAGDEIFCDFRLTEQVIDDYIAGRFDINPRDSGLYRIDRDIRSRVLETVSEVPLSGPVCVITSSEPINYGAWLIRTIPKYVALRDLSGPFSCDILCYAERPWQRGILSFIGVPDKHLIEQSFSRPYSSPLVLAPTWPNQEKFLDARSLGVMAELRARARARAGSLSYPRAIYVSRRQHSLSAQSASQIRPFRQEAAFEEALRRIGVTAIHPETLEFAETIRVFAHAEVVIGPQGAGMFNCVFCEPGTKVFDIEHLPNFLRGHCNLFSSCSLDYFIIVGAAGSGSDEHPVHKSIEIDIPKVVEFIRDYAGVGF